MTDANADQLFESINGHYEKVKLDRVNGVVRVRAGIDPRTIATGETILEALQDAEVQA